MCVIFKSHVVTYHEEENVRQWTEYGQALDEHVEIDSEPYQVSFYLLSLFILLLLVATVIHEEVSEDLAPEVGVGL